MFDPLSGVAILAVAAIAACSNLVTERRAAQRRSLELQRTQRDEQLRYQKARLELHNYISDAAHHVGRSSFGQPD